MYVGDVKDVKDTSNTPKGCNAMYVEDKVTMITVSGFFTI